MHFSRIVTSKIKCSLFSRGNEQTFQPDFQRNIFVDKENTEYENKHYYLIHKQWLDEQGTFHKHRGIFFFVQHIKGRRDGRKQCLSINKEFSQYIFSNNWHFNFYLERGKFHRKACFLFQHKKPISYPIFCTIHVLEFPSGLFSLLR